MSIKLFHLEKIDTNLSISYQSDIRVTFPEPGRREDSLELALEVDYWVYDLTIQKTHFDELCNVISR